MPASIGENKFSLKEKFISALHGDTAYFKSSEDSSSACKSVELIKISFEVINSLVLEQLYLCQIYMFAMLQRFIYIYLL